MAVATSPERTSNDFLRLMAGVLAIKYTANGLAVLIQALRRDSLPLADWAFSTPLTLTWISRMSAVPVAIAAFVWLKTRRPRDGAITMALVGVDALLKMLWSGVFFLNHHMLQLIMGALGLFAVGREVAGDRPRDAWRPLAWVTVAVWGIAAVKKLYPGTMLTGEFIAYMADFGRHTILWWLSRSILAPGGEPAVPSHCCTTEPIEVSAFAGGVAVAAGVGLALAEFSPVVLAAFSRTRKTVGPVLVGLSVTAVAIANETDFGLTLLALSSLWTEGRILRRVVILAAVCLGVAYVWARVR